MMAEKEGKTRAVDDVREPTFNHRQLFRTLRTVRHLHYSQVAARAYRWTQRRWPLRERHTPSNAGVVTEEAFVMPPVHSLLKTDSQSLVSSLEGGTLELLNEELPFGKGCWDWRLGPASQHRLWTVTLHYHEWLYRLGVVVAGGGALADRAMSLWHDALQSWLQQCDLEQPGAECLAWNSYAIATRLGWSIRNWQLFAESSIDVPHALRQQWRSSLFRQADYLYRHLEWDLRGNHLLRDAVGLAWAARFFADSPSRRWSAKAEQIALQQASEQILDDGGHFERSPYYHVEVMQDWLALASLLAGEQAREVMRQTWANAAEYARWVRHPDGTLVHFNDGAAKEATAALRQGAALAPQGDWSLPEGGRYCADSGIAIWHGEPWTVFWDVGRVGPACQPGHAHADTLSLECSFRGVRLFVDPGCHSYDNDDRRRYDRSTKAHNTVCIDQMNSSEVWHIFRVGRRAVPRDVDIHIGSDSLSGIAAHDGYDHLAGRPRHRRSLQLQNAGAFCVTDEVEGKRHHLVEGGWLIGPGWHVLQEENAWRLDGAAGAVSIRFEANQKLNFQLTEAPYHPDYGVEQIVPRICWWYEGKLPLRVRCHITEVSAPPLAR